LKSTFLALMLLIVSAPSFAQCVINFTWVQTANNVISFTDASTGVTLPSMYQWNFGDNTSSGLQNPVHTFNVPGTYNVCLTVMDSGGCNSTFCSSVTVTGTLICVMTVSINTTLSSCSTCPDGTAYANPQNGTAPYTFSWNTIPPQNTNYATGLLPGTYTCSITDVNGCTASGMANIVTSVCTANFTYSQTTTNTIAFTSTSIGAPPNTQYLWGFDDASYSNLQNPTHFYTNAGTYNVGLRLIDSSGSCSDSINILVTVTGVNCTGFSAVISTVNSTCSTCNVGSATANPQNGTAPYIYQWNTSATTQTINNLGYGNYSCYVVDANGCYDYATGFVDTNNATCTSFFTLNPTATPHTYQAVNLSTGSPIYYHWSWGDGNHSYTQFPTHTYANAGFYNVCLFISDSLNGCQNTYCFYSYLARFDANNAIVTIEVVPSTVGINPPGYDEWLHISTLAENDVFLNCTLSEPSPLEVRIVDSIGKLFAKRNYQLTEGNHEINLDARSLPAGVYFITVTDEKSNSVTKKIVKM
jgi:PKD repeat protein